jgi:hypothetical protein
VFRRLFGNDAFAGAPEHWAERLKAAVPAETFEELGKLFARRGTLRQYGGLLFSPSAVRRPREAVALVLVLEHHDLLDGPPARGGDVEARRIIELSVTLEPRAWNPAWGWAFGYSVGGIAPEALRPHVERVVYAFDHCNASFFDLFRQRSPIDLMPASLRAGPLFMCVRFELEERLEAEDFATYVAAMTFGAVGEGETIGQKVIKALAADAGDSSEVRSYAERIVSHALHLLGQKALATFDLLNVQRLERCAAAINGYHLPSRVELAQVLADMDDAIPGEGHLERAKAYAAEAIDLIDSQAFDIGPPFPVGVADAVSLAHIARMRDVMAGIVAR